MVPGYLLLCLAGGIVWADRGGPWPSELARAAALIGTLVVLRALSLAVSFEARGGPRGRARNRTDRSGLALLIAGLVCFDVGWVGLSQRLRQAAEDAERARAAGAGTIRLAEARVVDRRTTRWGETVILDRVAVADGGAPLPSRLQLRIPTSPRPGTRTEQRLPSPVASRAEQLLQPGVFVRLGLRIAPLGGSRNPGSPDPVRAAARRGLAARARLPDPSWILAREGPTDPGERLVAWVAATRAGLRRQVEARWAPLGGAEAVGLARALALGDRAGLPESTRTAFERLGLAHLLAVSGLHVGLVAGLVGWLTLRAFAHAQAFGRLGTAQDFWLPMLTACLAATLYAGLSGAGVSVSRACALVLLVAGLRLAGRRLDPGPALAGVAAWLLARDPAALFDLGAQLSFGSCLALWAGGVWRGPKSDPSGLVDERARLPEAAQPGTVDRDPSRRVGFGVVCLGARALLTSLLEALLQMMKVSLAVSLGTLGILAAHGLPPAWLAPIFNAVAIPWTAGLTLPGALLALGWTLLGPVGAWSDRAIGGLLWPAGALGRVAERVAACDGVGWLSDRPGTLPWIAGAALGGLGLLALRRGREPLAVLIWLGLALVGLASPQAGAALGRAPRVVFFDVGQGDAALIETEAHSVLIDTGPGPPDGSGGRRLVRAVQSLGRGRIDVLVVTHADLDHRGGAEHVLERLRPRELWLPEVARLDPVLQRLAERAGDRGGRVRWRSAGADFERLDADLALRILWPPAGASALSRNEGSLVLAVDLRATRFLFTADISDATERVLLRRQASSLAAEVLKVGHHGSRHSTAAAFLRAVAPRVAVLSAPCQPTRGLPSPVVLERLRALAIPIAWTGREGALSFGVAGVGEADGEEAGAGRIPEIRAWSRPRSCAGLPTTGRGSAADETRRTPFDEGALRLAGVLGPA